MITTNLEIQDLCARVAPAVVNGLYQGVLLTAAVALTLRLLVRTNAATRHAIWFATLILVSLVIPAHCWLDSARSAAWSKPQETILDTPTILPSSVSAPPPSPLPALSEASQAPEIFEPDLTGPDPGPAGIGTPDPGMQPPVEIENRVAVEGMESRPENAGSIFNRILRPVQWNLASERAVNALAALSILWMLGAGIRLLILTWRLISLQRLSRGSLPAEPALQEVVDQLRLASGIKRDAKLRLSPENRCPVVLGYFRPVILLPSTLARDCVETRQVLSHELAHIGRYDDWTNLIQHFVQAVFLFHPAVWWIGKHLSLEREIACDDHVLQQGAGRRSYALALVSVASQIQEHAPLLAPGVSNTHSQLKQRIDMILNTRRNSSTGVAKGRLTSLVALTALMAAAALYAAPRVVVAASSDVAPSANVAVFAGVAPTAVVSTDVQVDPTADVTVSVSDGEPSPTPSPGGVGSGPKFKPEKSTDEAPEPPEIGSVPQPPVTPVMPTPRVARAGRNYKGPRPSDLMEADGAGDGSLEQRLDRLEKMVRELAEQQGIKRPHGMVYFRDGQNRNGNIDEQQAEKMKQLAERQAARAAEQAERAVEMAERANRDIEAGVQEDGVGRGEPQEALQRQLEGLRKAKEGLGKQMEQLDREIKKLQKQQQRGDGGKERRGEQRSDKLPAQNTPDPEAQGGN